MKVVFWGGFEGFHAYLPTKLVPESRFHAEHVSDQNLECSENARKLTMKKVVFRVKNGFGGVFGHFSGFWHENASEVDTKLYLKSRTFAF